MSAAENIAPDLLTVAELATLLRVERKTAYKLVEDNAVPGIRRIGPRLIRLHRATVVAWLETGERGDSRKRRTP